MSEIRITLFTNVSLISGKQSQKESQRLMISLCFSNFGCRFLFTPLCQELTQPLKFMIFGGCSKEIKKGEALSGHRNVLMATL